MERVEKTFEIDMPVNAVYNQWTQFEEFPHFMEGVKRVHQVDDTHLHWHVEIGGRDKEFDAEITEQVPDKVIAWRSISGPSNAGAAHFEPMGGDRTRVRFMMEYEPETPLEKAGDALGFVSRKVEKTIEDFKRFIEKRGRETGAWRGEVHGGQPMGSQQQQTRGGRPGMP